MTTIETERLRLRRFNQDDWQALQQMIVGYQASAYAAYDHPWPTSAEEIKQVARWFASGERYLAVCLKETGRLIGFVALNPGEEGRRLDLGYCFDLHHHGQGYATEACRAVLRRAFEELRAEEVVANTAAANGPSCQLLERLGFTKTGEGVTSLRKGADGTPIEFVGCSYVLAREAWGRGAKG